MSIELQPGISVRYLLSLPFLTNGALYQLMWYMHTVYLTVQVFIVIQSFGVKEGRSVVVCAFTI